MKYRLLLTLTVAVAGLAAGCTAEKRSALDADTLLAPVDAIKPVANHLFLPVGDARLAQHDFAGTLTIPEHRMMTIPDVIEPAVIEGRRTQLFPAVELQFFSLHNYLVPVSRELQASPDTDSFWHIQVEPGRTWSETGDNGMSRASFPFVLTNRMENETYNGIATFLFDGDSVSMLRYQLVQQLTPFMVETWFVAAGQTAATYEPAAVGNAQMQVAFENEIAGHLPWGQWSDLEARHGVELFADFDAGIAPEKTVASGLVIDDVIYVRAVDTPFGPYPYPREMRHGVWSATKTLGGFVTLARLAEKYGDEILDYRIADYLDVTAPHDGWDDVTFRHAMSMATGIGTGSENLEPNDINDGYIMSDFDAYRAFYFAPTLEEKLDYLFQVPNHPWGPGEVARYRDRDIFVVAAAMDSLHKQREGADADLWEMMMREVYRPIGIHHLPQNKTLETDRPDVPLLAWGIYVTLDDVAKISRLIQDGGAHDGEQILSKDVVAEALYETDVRGLPTGAENRFGEKTYHLSFWHEPYVSASGQTYTAPQMLGWGGNVVQLMPNGMIGFRIGNGGYVDVEQMMIIADRMRPFDEYDRRGQLLNGDGR